MFSIVVATDLNNGIGKDNKLPWRLKKDMTFFNDLTTEHGGTVLKYEIKENELASKQRHGMSCLVERSNNTVIMGRKTWESIPDKFKPLPNRFNVIISKTLKSNYSIIEDAIFVDDFNSVFEVLDAREKLRNSKSVVSSHCEDFYVIGGAEIYRQAIEHELCESIYITQINKSFECDTFFPEYMNKFQETASSPVFNENGVEFTFKVFGKK